MKHIILLVSIFVLQTSPVFAEIYKWIDDEGKTHYGDKPSENSVNKQMNLDLKKTVKSQAEKERLQNRFKKAVEEAEQQTASRKAKVAREKIVKAQRKDQKRACYEASVQLVILQELHLPAYRTESGKFRAKWKYDMYKGKRVYLEESERFTETKRAQKEVKAKCKSKNSSDALALVRKRWIVSENCAARIADYQFLKDKNTKTPRIVIENARKLIDKYCKK